MTEKIMEREEARTIFFLKVHCKKYAANPAPSAAKIVAKISLLIKSKSGITIAIANKKGFLSNSTRLTLVIHPSRVPSAVFMIFKL